MSAIYTHPITHALILIALAAFVVLAVRRQIRDERAWRKGWHE